MTRKTSGYRISLGTVSLPFLFPLRWFCQGVFPLVRWIWHLESKHISLENGLGEKLQWDTKRGREFQNLAHMIFCCHGLPEQYLPSPQKMEKWMARVEEPPREFRDQMDDVLRCLWVLATDPRYNQAFAGKKITQRIAPVEFVFIG